MRTLAGYRPKVIKISGLCAYSVFNKNMCLGGSTCSNSCFVHNIWNVTLGFFNCFGPVARERPRSHNLISRDTLNSNSRRHCRIPPFTKVSLSYASNVEACMEYTCSERKPSNSDQAITPNLPTKIIPAKIRWLKLPGKSPMDMRIPPLKLKILLESSPLKSRILVRRSAAESPMTCETRLSCWVPPQPPI